MNYIYRYFNKKNQIIYVGLTSRPLKKRVKEHSVEKLQSETDHIDFALVDSEADMRMYELYYINKYRPKFNKRDLYFDGNSLILPELTFLPYLEDETSQNLYTNVDKRDFVFRCEGGTITFSVLDPLGKSPDTVAISLTGSPQLTRQTLQELIDLVTEVQNDLSQKPVVSIKELLAK